MMISYEEVKRDRDFYSSYWGGGGGGGGHVHMTGTDNGNQKEGQFSSKTNTIL